jgi:hypothetical protein
MQFLVGRVNRWWEGTKPSKLPANPDGQVDLYRVEENKQDVAAILVGLLPTVRTKVSTELRSILRTPSHLNI